MNPSWKFPFINRTKAFTASQISTPNPNEQISNLIQHLSQVIFQIDLKGRWVYLNKAWEDHTGFDLKESRSKNVLEFIHPEDRVLCNQSIISLVNREANSFQIKTRFITSDGNYLWANIKAKYLHSRDSSIIGSFSNISNEVHAEELARANFRSLSSLVDNLSGLIYRGRNDRDWTMEYVSAGCYGLTGYNAEQLQNQSVTFASLIHPADRENVWNEVQLALNDWSPFEIIYRIRTLSGQEKWIWERGQGNFSSNGEMLSLQGHMTDITSWKKDYLRTLNDTLYVGDTPFTRRHLFIDRLKLAISRSQLTKGFNFALLMIQADRLNILAADLDETECEDMRAQISLLLSEVIQPLTTLCMINDDKFAILVENIQSLNDISDLTQRIHDRLSNPIVVNKSDFFITASIGITTNSPQYTDYHNVIKDADTALIRAKVLGGGCNEIFDARQNSLISLANRMTTEIYEAIEQDKITVLYQPIYSLKNHHIVGLEVIPVWEHQRKGQVLLKQYLPIELNHKLVHKLNQHILAKLSDQLKELQRPEIHQTEIKLFLILNFFNNTKLDPQFSHDIQTKLFENTSLNLKYYLLLSADENSSLSTQISSPFLTFCLHNDLDLCVEFDDMDKFICAYLQTNSSSMIRIKNPVTHTDKKKYKNFKKILNFIAMQDVPIIISSIKTKLDTEEVSTLETTYLQGDYFSKAIDLQTANTLLTKPASFNNNDIKT